MAASENLKRLREEALARHRAATQKVSRLRNVNGVEIGGTKYDPRVPATDIRKMNTREVNRYLRNVNAFMQRSNAFEAGAGMRPLPKAATRKFRRTESTNYRLGQQQKRAIANIRLPDTKLPNGKVIRKGKTLGETLANQEQQEAMGTQRGTRAYQDRMRPNFKGIASVDDLNKLERAIARKNSPAYIARHRKKTMENMIAVLEGGGVSPATVQAAKNLTGYQADVLWNYHPSFARTSGEHYQATKDETSDIRMSTSDADRERTLNEQIEWASQLQEEAPQRPTPRKGSGRR